MIHGMYTISSLAPFFIASKGVAYPGPLQQAENRQSTRLHELSFGINFYETSIENLIKKRCVCVCVCVQIFKGFLIKYIAQAASNNIKTGCTVP